MNVNTYIIIAKSAYIPKSNRRRIDHHPDHDLIVREMTLSVGLIKIKIDKPITSTVLVTILALLTPSLNAGNFELASASPCEIALFVQQQQQARQTQFRFWRERFEIAPGSLTDRMLATIEEQKFLSQVDAKFEAQGWLLQDGGLCGPTLIGGLLHAIADRFPKLSGLRSTMADMVTAVGYTINNVNCPDPLHGLAELAAIEFLQSLCNLAYVPELYRIQPSVRSPLFNASNEALNLTMVNTPGAPHWILVLATKASAMEALVLDPNFSDMPIVAKIRDKRFVSREFLWAYDKADPEILSQILIFGNADPDLTPEMHERYRR